MEAESIWCLKEEVYYIQLSEMRLTSLASIQEVRVYIFVCLFHFILIHLLGVSRSIPVVSFFTKNVDREIWSAGAAAFNVVNASTNSLGELVAGSRVVGRLAAATNYNGYLNFINTDSTARDMLQITKAYGMDKIQYWGFS